jgi:hypothetical protein
VSDIGAQHVGDDERERAVAVVFPGRNVQIRPFPHIPKGAMIAVDIESNAISVWTEEARRWQPPLKARLVAAILAHQETCERLGTVGREEQHGDAAAEGTAGMKNGVARIG